MHVRAKEPDAEQTHHGKVPIKDSYRGGFCDQLPAELPPEHSVFHTIPLEDKNAVPPARKVYRLSRPELEERKEQVIALLAHTTQWQSLWLTSFICTQEDRRSTHVHRLSVTIA